MKRFHFRLESLLDIRKQAEEEIKKDMARKNSEVLAARREKQSLAGQLNSFFAEEKKQRQRVLDLLALRHSISFRTHLQKEIVSKQQQIDGLCEEANTIRAQLAKARKECRVLEILKEKKLAQWKKEYKMEEQEFVDDVSQKGYIRKLRAAEVRDDREVSAPVAGGDR